MQAEQIKFRRFSLNKSQTYYDRLEGRIFVTCSWEATYVPWKHR